MNGLGQCPGKEQQYVNEMWCNLFDNKMCAYLCCYSMNNHICNNMYVQQHVQHVRETTCATTSATGRATISAAGRATISAAVCAKVRAAISATTRTKIRAAVYHACNNMSNTACNNGHTILGGQIAHAQLNVL